MKRQDVEPNAPISPPATVDAAKVAADLAALFDRGISANVESRLDELDRRLADLSANVEAGVGSASDRAVAEVPLEIIKSTMTQVFIDSGLLEALVTRVVRRRVDEFGVGAGAADGAHSGASTGSGGSGGSGGGAGGPDADATRQTCGAMVKEFLAANLGTIFNDQIDAVVEGSVARFLSSERVKELIDQKFRALTTYMKTDVIPKVVRQLVGEGTSA